MKSVSPSAWLCLVVFGLALVDHFAGVPLIGRTAAVLMVVFVVLEAGAAPRSQVVAAILFIVAGWVAAAWGGDVWDGLWVGLGRTMKFFLLFGAIAWLQVPADSSPTLKSAQGMAMRQPPGRRYLMIETVSHVLGSVLNLAGISLLAKLVREQADGGDQARLTRAITNAFSGAACWSPFYVAMSVAMSVVPGLTWLGVAPLGIACAVLLMAISWALDRTLYRDRTPAPHPEAGGDRFTWRMAAIPASLFVAVIGLVEAGNLPIPVALGLIGPVYAVGWMIAQSGGRTPGLATAQLARRVVTALPGLRSEVLLFLGANMFGAWVATAVPPSVVGQALSGMALPVDLAVFAVMGTILVVAAAGVHPVMPVVVIGGVLPPDVLGIAPELLGAMMLATWGLGAAVSPFSGTSLFMRRVAGVSPFTIGWVWNGPYAVIGTLAVGAVIVAVRHLGIY